MNKKFVKVFPAARISIALVLLAACVLLTAEMLGFTPKEDRFLVKSRTQIAESLGLQMSVLLPERDFDKVTKLIRQIVKRNPEILSAGIRQSDGRILYQSNNHALAWGDYDKDASSTTHVLVPMLDNGQLWANIELRFADLASNTATGFLTQPIFRLILFFLVIGFFVYLVFMLRTLRQLDPSAVIPGRVNAAFDTLAEGVVIVDENEYVLLTNKAFRNKVDQSENELLGMRMTDLKWKSISVLRSGKEFPWRKVIQTGKSSIGAQLLYERAHGQSIKFAMNASPILDTKEQLQGVLVTVEDISQLEEKNADLKTVANALRKTQFKVQQQNKELTYLATRDPLTGCLNRRSLAEQFDALFEKAKAGNTELVCVMLDIDHFKKVNDTFGHATGDEVIKMLADVLRSNTQSGDLVGRYGGEEFCLVCAGMPDDAAMRMAERIRLKTKKESSLRFPAGPHVTVSLGVASLHDHPTSPEALNRLADEALFISKESGRNQVTRWKQGIQGSSMQHAGTDERAGAPATHDIEAESEITELRTRIDQLEDLASNVSAELEYNQSYDALTGLPGQILFYDRVQQAIGRSVRHDRMAAVLITDIEMFSQINTNLGRAIGDQVLKHFSDQLNAIFRRIDGVTRLSISRFAGDEFAVLLTDLPNQDHVTWSVKRLLDLSDQPINIAGHTIHLSIRVGVSIFPIDASDADELFNHAISAKKYCKLNKAPLSYLFFDSHLQELSRKHMRLETELREAIEQDQWQLLLQPKFDVGQQRISGAEALIRWQHPQRGLLTPAEFIQFAEQRKLILPIGDWVIRQACRQIAELMRHGIDDCSIAINLSPVQLVHADVAQTILAALDEFSVPPRLFEVEITEDVLIEHVQQAQNTLKRLSARGIRVAVDDFGTGYSSLKYLRGLPIDVLKIDRSFIKDILTVPDDDKIVRTVISMAHSLDLRIVAEGVEDPEQLQLLQQMGCDEIQGYLVSKPTDLNRLIDLIQTRSYRPDNARMKSAAS